jgi:hypothetical protein
MRRYVYLKSIKNIVDAASYTHCNRRVGIVHKIAYEALQMEAIMR